MHDGCYDCCYYGEGARLTHTYVVLKGVNCLCLFFHVAYLGCGSFLFAVPFAIVARYAGLAVFAVITNRVIR